MKDPERINRVIEKVRAVWQTEPDLRLGQIVVAIGGTADPFYVEDDDFEQRLDEWAKKVDLCPLCLKSMTTEGHGRADGGPIPIQTCPLVPQGRGYAVSPQALREDIVSGFIEALADHRNQSEEHADRSNPLVEIRFGDGDK